VSRAWVAPGAASTEVSEVWALDVGGALLRYRPFSHGPEIVQPATGSRPSGLGAIAMAASLASMGVRFASLHDGRRLYAGLPSALTCSTQGILSSSSASMTAQWA
jgi:hypothetical protein